jgi:hypothetical protein
MSCVLCQAYVPAAVMGAPATMQQHWQSKLLLESRHVGVPVKVWIRCRQLWQQRKHPRGEQPGLMLCSRPAS